jgi:hypothetical protein
MLSGVPSERTPVSQSDTWYRRDGPTPSRYRAERYISRQTLRMASRTGSVSERAWELHGSQSIHGSHRFLGPWSDFCCRTSSSGRTDGRTDARATATRPVFQISSLYSISMQRQQFHVPLRSRQASRYFGTFHQQCRRETGATVCRRLVVTSAWACRAACTSASPRYLGFHGVRELLSRKVL